MPARTLVFSNDSKTVEAVSQVLGELSVPFDHLHELSAVMNRIAEGEFDTVVVDSDDVENATLIFNKIRNSPNTGAMTIAIVNGKSGVPTAFRIGAKQVMSKPLSLEQARTTLRNALALQRREAQENKAAGIAGSASAAAVGVSTGSNNAFLTERASPSPEMRSAASVATSPTLNSAAVSKPAVDETALGPSGLRRSESVQGSLGSAAAAAPAVAKEAAKSEPALAAPKLEEAPRPIELKTPSPKVAKPENAAPAAPPAEPAADAPAFAILKAHESKRNPILVPALVVVLLCAAFGATWTMQPAFRNAVLDQYGKVSGKLLHKQTAPPKMISAPAPGPAAGAPTTTPNSTTNGVAAPPDTTPLAQGFQDGESAAEAPSATATNAADNIAVGDPVTVPEELADAHIAHQVNAWYPTKARQAHIRGSVVLKVSVAADGSVTTTDVVSGAPQLTLSAQECVKQWKYQPYFQNGKATGFETQATVTFPATPAASTNH